MKPVLASREIIIYADGASSGNPGPAGAGVVLIYGSHRREISAFLGEKVTNNVAELSAVEIALQAVKHRELPVRIHLDSSYVIGLLTRGWKARKNRELVAQLRSLASSFPRLTIVKVAGHAGIAENERADALARAAIAKK